MLDLLWLIPALPLTGFVTLTVAGRRLGDPVAGWLATATTAGSFAATFAAFIGLLGRPAEERAVGQRLYTWLTAGELRVDAGLLADPLSLTMALFVTGVGAAITLYAVGYMRGDARFSAFFAYLNLFVFSMLVLVLADSFPVMFVGWEGVGAASWMLISFWFTRERAAVAAKKAFLVNRIGDVGFLLAMFVVFDSTGSLTFAGVFDAAPALARSTGTAAALLFLLGAVGKSAQLPLFVWLPDAMEGPTPVSALMHAATMVTAGVYLLVRINPLLDQAPAALTVIGLIGGGSALVAALAACAQDDIKKVLAYSTISQLGYMFLAIGARGYTAGVFHMVTHAFFKATLFLAAGSVIHALRDEQDMKRMGGLWRAVPFTAASFAAGALALAGIPPFAGFWSKDEVLLATWADNKLLWALAVATAALTAYYIARQAFLVFLGPDRWREAARQQASSSGVAAGDGESPHEGPRTMRFGLGLLAVLALVGGAVNLPFRSSGLDLLEQWLEPVFGERARPVGAGAATTWALLAVTLAAASAGIGVAYQAWLRRRELGSRLGPDVLRRAWYLDAGLSRLVGGPGRRAASLLATGDRVVVDGAVNGAGRLVVAAGTALRRVQSGYVRRYALTMVIGAVALLAFMVARAR